MKRIVSFVLLTFMLFSLFGCESDFKRADSLAKEFISALLLRDEEGMKTYLHPDYVDSAMPNDEFYNFLIENEYFSVGNELTALDSMTKDYLEDDSLNGKAIECGYVVRTNELFYNFELIILENDNGYGVVSVTAALNRDVKYYQQDTVD